MCGFALLLPVNALTMLGKWSRHQALGQVFKAILTQGPAPDLARGTAVPVPALGQMQPPACTALTYQESPVIAKTM